MLYSVILTFVATTWTEFDRWRQRGTATRTHVTHLGRFATAATESRTGWEWSITMRTAVVIGFQVCTTAGTSFGILVIVASTVGAGIVLVATAGTELRSGGERLAAVAAVYRGRTRSATTVLSTRWSRCGLAAAEGGMVVVGCHQGCAHAAATHTAESAHHTDGHEASQDTALAIRHAVYRPLGSLEHLFLLPCVARNVHRTLLSDGLFHPTTFLRVGVNVDFCDIEMRQIDTVV